MLDESVESSVPLHAGYEQPHYPQFQPPARPHRPPSIRQRVRSTIEATVASAVAGGDGIRRNVCCRWLRLVSPVAILMLVSAFLILQMRASELHPDVMNHVALAKEYLANTALACGATVPPTATVRSVTCIREVNSTILCMYDPVVRLGAAKVTAKERRAGVCDGPFVPKARHLTAAVTYTDPYHPITRIVTLIGNSSICIQHLAEFAGGECSLPWTEKTPPVPSRFRFS